MKLTNSSMYGTFGTSSSKQNTTNLIITTDKNKLFIRSCLKHHVYHSEKWLLYADLQRILKNPPCVWRENNDYQFLIAWDNDKPIGILTFIPWDIHNKIPGKGGTLEENIKNFQIEYSRQIQSQIYILPKYRNKGIATKLVETAITTLGIYRVIFTYAGDSYLLKLGNKFTGVVIVKGKPNNI
jgi:GNAT superfamily N-acetyltransferase